MKPFYSIAVPKPCHENWNDMTPNDKGRFCDSCSKTVIDFTKKDTSEIQDILHQNRKNSICGHIRQEQLDAINIQIPYESFSSEMSFHKLFFLVLLAVMGTTLFNCTNSNDKVQKINKVEVVDTMNENELNNDTLKHPIQKDTSKKDKITEIVGAIAYNDNSDRLNPPLIEGEIVPYHDNIVMGFIESESPPEFPNTLSHLSIEDKREAFNNRISEFVNNNFKIETTANLNLLGTQKIYAQFKIDNKGLLKDIKVRAPHALLEKETIRVLKLLPKFIPAKQRNQNVSVIYNLPIAFKVDD